MDGIGYQDGEEDVEEHNNDEEVEHEEEARRHRLPAKATAQGEAGAANRNYVAGSHCGLLCSVRTTPQSPC
jgi:hypothetical protein